MQNVLLLIGLFFPLAANSVTKSVTVDTLFNGAAEEYGIDEKLLRAVCWVETGHNVKAIRMNDGKPGLHSYGICQVQLGTARLMGFKGSVRSLGKPYHNIRMAAAYIRYQLKRYHGDHRKAIIAYNRGSYRSTVPYTDRYIANVFTAYKDKR